MGIEGLAVEPFGRIRMEGPVQLILSVAKPGGDDIKRVGVPDFSTIGKATGPLDPGFKPLADRSEGCGTSRRDSGIDDLTRINQIPGVAMVIAPNGIYSSAFLSNIL